MGFRSCRPFLNLWKNKPISVCVEGNIGSGKTTFLNYFRDCSAVIEISEEPVKKWRNFYGYNPLAHMYADPERWGSTFQSVVLLTLLQMHTAPQVRPIRLMERSIYSARYIFIENLHRTKLISDIEYTILCQWFTWAVENNNTNIDFIIYMQTEPNTVYKRIKARQRPEEQSIPLSQSTLDSTFLECGRLVHRMIFQQYMKHIHRLHEDWLIKQKTFRNPATEILVLNANQEPSAMEEIADRLKSHIMSTDTLTDVT